MNGAESLVRTLVGAEVNVCFTNPGTSEMHFVAALDRVEGMRCVLCLFEGVVTGAADGYGRMTDRPASTLLHLGPGLGNGLANLHNAKRARTPIVNIVGEHATYHVEHDAPLTSDIEGIARPVSGWVRTSPRSRSVAQDGADAIAAAMTAPGQIATLILPANTAWEEADGAAAPVAPPATAKASEDALGEAVRLLRSGEKTLIMLAGFTLREKGLAIASRIAQATGASLLAQTSNARVERGAGRVAVNRVFYPVDQALDQLKDFRNVVLICAKAPVAFFAYPGKPSVLTPDGCRIHTLATPTEDGIDALERLAEAVGAGKFQPRPEPFQRAAKPTGALTPESIASAVAATLPENAIVADESITIGRGLFPYTKTCPPHDWLQVTGGSIGCGPPLATGAAVACRDRKVLNLEGDGSAMYTVQSLWTQAREGLDVTTVILSNRTYAILKHELANVGAGNPGRKALDMLEIGRPDIGWVDIARGMGVPGARVTTAEELTRQLERGFAEPGPYLIEAVI